MNEASGAPRADEVAEAALDAAIDADPAIAMLRDVLTGATVDRDSILYNIVERDLAARVPRLPAYGAWVETVSRREVARRARAVLNAIEAKPRRPRAGDATQPAATVKRPGASNNSDAVALIWFLFMIIVLIAYTCEVWFGGILNYPT